MILKWAILGKCFYFLYFTYFVIYVFYDANTYMYFHSGKNTVELLPLLTYFSSNRSEAVRQAALLQSIAYQRIEVYLIERSIF